MEFIKMIIGITGTQAAGKGAVVEELKKKGFTHYSAREYLASKVLESGLTLERHNFQKTADKLRKAYGSEFVVKELYNQAQEKGGNTIIESIRTIGEVEFLRKQTNFLLVSIDADVNTRYERAISRKSELDHVSFEQFVNQEKAELENTEAHMMNIRKCIDLSDIKLTNNGTLEELKEQIVSLLNSKL
jgi:dephospho-CoA kinase